jgi:hypothetical protein
MSSNYQASIQLKVDQFAHFAKKNEWKLSEPTILNGLAWRLEAKPKANQEGTTFLGVFLYCQPEKPWSVRSADARVTLRLKSTSGQNKDLILAFEARFHDSRGWGPNDFIGFKATIYLLFSSRKPIIISLAGAARPRQRLAGQGGRSPARGRLRSRHRQSLTDSY